MHISYI